MNDRHHNSDNSVELLRSGLTLGAMVTNLKRTGFLAAGAQYAAM